MRWAGLVRLFRWAGAFAAIAAGASTAAAAGHPAQHMGTRTASTRTHAHHDDPSLGFASDVTQTPAYRYARLDRDACHAELTARGIAFTPVDTARGVLAPVRLAGPIHGITYHSELPESQRPSSPYEIFDCRLVLALDDFSGLLAQHGVVEVVHLSAYRPPRARSWPDGKIGQRHDGALALDAARFIRADGTVLDVQKDFHGRIGSKTCGPKTGPWPVTPDATELRNIVCEAADAHLFQVELTPDYNWQHRNHFHLEVTANVGWFLVH